MTAVVVATRNEPTINGFCHRLKSFCDEVIVCDESNDGGATEWRAHKGGASVLRCSGGIGPSLMAGWRLALEHGHARVIQIDAGGSHSINDIPKLGTDADITIGSRFVFGGTYTGRQWRAGASRAYGWSMNWRSGERLSDWTSGFRAFKADALEDLLVKTYRASMHGWQAEVLLRAFEAGMTVREVPINYYAGESAMRPKHAWEAARVR